MSSTEIICLWPDCRYLCGEGPHGQGCRYAEQLTGLPVYYQDEVKEERVRQIKKLLAPEFEIGNWERVE